MNKFIEKIPLVLFLCSITMIVYSYGVISHKYNYIPLSLIKHAMKGYKQVSTEIYDQWYYRETDHEKQIQIIHKGAIQQGLTLITSISTGGKLSANVINLRGEIVHSWNVNWFRVWPDASHLSESEVPKTLPGTQLHGAIVTDDGGLIFNYDGLGLVSLNACSEVVWRLAERTHHSIFRDESNNLWVSGVTFHDAEEKRLPNFKPPYREETILKVSLKGEVLDRISIIDILKKNQLEGLLYIRSPSRFNTKTTGDVLHLNDIEVFPSYLEEGVFSHGDIMMSFRNINTVVVVDSESFRIKYLSVGHYIRQHDPDFIDGNSFSVVDNNNMDGTSYPHFSKIKIENAVKHDVRVYFSGSEANPFYTSKLGKHQWLQNGNLLITDAVSGRVIEVSDSGDVVWVFENIVAPGYLGIVSQAERLSAMYTSDFFKQAVSKCQ